MSVIIFAVGLISGFVASRLLIKRTNTTDREPDKIRQLEQELLSYQKDKEHLEARLEKAVEEFKKQEEREKDLQEEKLNLKVELTQLESNSKFIEEKLKTQNQELEKIRNEFSTEFKIMANAILKQNSEDISKIHQKELGEILNPLKEKIKVFEDTVNKKYVDETKERSALKQEIKQLLELNQTLNKQAQNLTNALKGDNKKQGNWGELVLERILESSGLIKGEEYETQYSDHNADNKRIQPDILIKLPDQKHIIIDSKVSLVAYDNFMSSEDETEKEAALKAHVLSVKNHVKQLSDKNYQSGLNINSPDFVLLFIPIESSFSLAIQADENLYSYAWEKKVVIVSPTTLLATLRTIASVWKHDKLTKNAQEIADNAGKMYAKFVGFLDDMHKIDRGINSTRNAYDEAMNKLKTGTGNLIRRAENLKIMGVKEGQKSISQDLIDESHE